MKKKDSWLQVGLKNQESVILPYLIGELGVGIGSYFY